MWNYITYHLVRTGEKSPVDLLMTVRFSIAAHLPQYWNSLENKNTTELVIFLSHGDDDI